MCLKNMTGCIPRGLLAFMWFSLTVGIGFKAIHNIGKEDVCGSSIWKERCQSFVPVGNSGAGTGSQLSASPVWLAVKGRWQQGTENRLRQLQLSSCLPPATDLSAVALIGSAGRCSWGFLPHKALLTPRQPLRLGHHPPHQPLAWHGMVRHGGQQSRRERERASQD